MSIATFQVRQRRPRKLSDPSFDFSPADLDKILAMPDEQLGWTHYRDLFGPHLPAGSYEESVYFLPGAFRFLLAHDPNIVESVPYAIIGFISKNSDALEADGLLDQARACIREYLAYLTRQFVVIHYDEAACRAKGWGITSFDEVQYADDVVDITEDLVKFERHADIAVDFVESLANPGDDPIKAAWFLEYARRPLTDTPWQPPCYPPITALIGDIDRIIYAAELVKPLIGSAPSYWLETFDTFGLE